MTATSPAPDSEVSRGSDEHELADYGYAQELKRSLSFFNDTATTEIYT